MGIGAAIARSLAASGANLVLFSRSEDKLQALAEEIKSAHEEVKVTYRAVDVGDHEAVDKAVLSVVKEMGEIDVLINNVSSRTTPPIRSNRQEKWIEGANQTTGRTRPRRPKRLPRSQNHRHHHHEQHKHQRLHVRHLQRAKPLHAHPIPPHRHNPQHHFHHRPRSPSLSRRGCIPCQQSLPRGLHQRPQKRALWH